MLNLVVVVDAYDIIFRYVIVCNNFCFSMCSYRVNLQSNTRKEIKMKSVLFIVFTVFATIACIYGCCLAVVFLMYCITL